MKDARKYLKLRITQSVIMVFAMVIIVFSVMFSAKAFSSSGEISRNELQQLLLKILVIINMRLLNK